MSINYIGTTFIVGRPTRHLMLPDLDLILFHRITIVDQWQVIGAALYLPPDASHLAEDPPSCDVGVIRLNRKPTTSEPRRTRSRPCKSRKSSCSLTIWTIDQSGVWWIHKPLFLFQRKIILFCTRRVTRWRAPSSNSSSSS